MDFLLKTFFSGSDNDYQLIRRFAFILRFIDFLWNQLYGKINRFLAAIHIVASENRFFFYFEFEII